MKLKWIATVCAMVVAAVVVAGVKVTCVGDAGSAVPPPRIARQDLPRSMAVSVPPFEVAWARDVLEAANMYFPAELEMLEVVHSEPTKQQAIDLAARVGVPVSPATAAELPDLPREEGCYWWDFGSVEVNVFQDGNAGVVWQDRDLPAEYFTDPNASPPPRITVDAAMAVADEFVRQAGLLPDGACMTDVTPRDAVSRQNEITGKEENAALACSVTYRRLRDGIPEGRIGVWVTGTAEVFSFSRNMRDVRSLGRYPILRPDEAREMIWSAASRVEPGANAPGFRPVRGVVEKVEMEYYDGATAWRYDTIQPIYILSGTAWDGEGQAQSFRAMVPAVRPQYLEPVDLPRAGGAAGSAGVGGQTMSRRHSSGGVPRPR